MANISKIKVSGVTYDIVDSSAIHSLDGYWNSGETQSAITAATSALAEAIAEQGYQTSGDVQNAITAATTPINNTLTAHTANTDIHVTVADKTAWNAKLDESDVAGLFGNVNYDSTTQRINFYHESTSGTVLAYIDASDFVKDGFLESVTIENKTISGESVPCLVFIWNTDAGIQETDIPLSGIFDPTNYVDVETYTAYTAATEAVLSGKQETLSAGTGIDITDNTISVTGIPLTIDDTVTSSSTNPVKSSGIYNFVTGETATKQDTLVNQTNIKSVGGESLLGAGNVATLHASIGTGDDAETLILELS